MRHFATAIALAATIGAGDLCGQSPIDFTASPALSTGDYAALLLSQAYDLHAAVRQSEVRPIIMFNPENMNVIDFHVLSSSDNMAVARARIDETVSWIRSHGIPLLARRLNADVSDAEFRVYYLVRQGNRAPRALLAWHNGSYMDPAN